MMETQPLLADQPSGPRQSRPIRVIDSEGRVCSSEPPWRSHTDDLCLQQAVVFLEDAVQYRSINHRVDSWSLYLYRWYFSRPCQWFLSTTIAVLLGLAFIEKPSSLSYTSDPRFRPSQWEPPCGLTESIEVLCLCILIVDFSVKGYLIGWEEFWKNKWLIGYIVMIAASVIDWTLSLSMMCNEVFRVRRLVRPFFLLQNSSLMKKTLKCLKRTLPEIASVMMLVALHLCLFTMIGMLLFTKREKPEYNGEWKSFFRDLPLSLSSMLVLLTTANNPDVMIPAYSLNRAYSIFFILFSVFGTYLLMNLLTAIVYNQFRGYLLISIQTSMYRRCLAIKAAFVVLCNGSQGHSKPRNADKREEVEVSVVIAALQRVKMKTCYKQAILRRLDTSLSEDSCLTAENFKMLFDELDKDQVKEHPIKPVYQQHCLQQLQSLVEHYTMTVFSNALALANVICLCTILVLDSEKAVSERSDYMEVINCVFICFYLLEMILKVFALGWKGYQSYRSNMFDGILTVLLVMFQVSIFALYKAPFYHRKDKHGFVPLWELVRLINMLIVLRFLRIISDIKLMTLVASTLVDLVKNLRAFAGILVVIYYVYAVLGIWLFEGVISPPTHSSMSNSSLENVTSNYSMECGTYEQLEYWPNNFDDFASSLVLLYNVMVVNNWHVFTDAYARYTTEWSKLYFVSWWLVSSVTWVNLFIALVLENFTYRWDRSNAFTVVDVEKTAYQTSIQLMFREHIQEPTEEQMMTSLRQHPHLPFGEIA